MDAIIHILESNGIACSHDSLQAAGIRIVSIAADINPDSYKAYAKDLPWTNAYCDYRSFQGQYFSQWGVAYTPAMYYVDKTGIVRGQYRSLKEIQMSDKDI